MDFQTQYRTPVRFNVSSGSPDRIIYGSRYAKDGTLEIFESGKESLYDFIQSHADSCDINVILARFKAGDPSVLSKKQGVFGDFTKIPRTFSGVLNMINDGRDFFSTLPPDVRSRYSNSFEKFVSALDDPATLADMAKQFSASPTPVSDGGVPPSSVFNSVSSNSSSSNVVSSSVDNSPVLNSTNV